MTDVSFYVLDTNQPRDRYTIACKITEKAYKLGQQVFILTETAEQTRAVDNQLWSFRQGSFVPHMIVDNNTELPAEQLPNTVLIGTTTQACDATVLINLTNRVPDNPEMFKRIVEIIDQDEQVKQTGRQRYKTYQSRHFELKTHHLQR